MAQQQLPVIALGTARGNPNYDTFYKTPAVKTFPGVAVDLTAWFLVEARIIDSDASVNSDGPGAAITVAVTKNADGTCIVPLDATALASGLTHFKTYTMLLSGKVLIGDEEQLLGTGNVIFERANS